MGTASRGQLRCVPLRLVRLGDPAYDVNEMLTVV